MYIIHQVPTKWATPAVSAWCGTHGVAPGRRYPTEDAALLAVCERVRDLAIIARAEPEMEASRSAGGTVTVQVLGVTYMVRAI